MYPIKVYLRWHFSRKPQTHSFSRLHWHHSSSRSAGTAASLSNGHVLRLAAPFLCGPIYSLLYLHPSKVNNNSRCLGGCLEITGLGTVSGQVPVSSVLALAEGDHTEVVLFIGLPEHPPNHLGSSLFQSAWEAHTHRQISKAIHCYSFFHFRTM